MRLTLRTLIAYLDGTVSREDAAALRAKISESPSIQELVERIRRVIAMRDLTSAPAAGEGLGGNPNDTCDYIDSSLTVEKVAEFEKLAIGSDVLLAEISQSHQILSDLTELDCGVSGRLRNRLYKLTESIYRQNSDEPEVFPVVEDHSSIREEYDDVSKSPSSKSEFKLSPPVISTDENEAPSQIESMLTVDKNRPSRGGGADPVVSSTKIKRKNDTGKFRVDSPPDDPFGEILTNSQSYPLDPVPVKSTSETDKPGSRAPRQNLLPVILITASLTALTCLVAASYIFSGKDDTDRTADNRKSESADAKGENEKDEKSSGDPNNANFSGERNSGKSKTNGDQGGKLDEGTVGDNGKSKKTKILPSRKLGFKGDKGNQKVGLQNPKSGSNGKRMSDSKSGKSKEDAGAFLLLKNKDYGKNKAPTNTAKKNAVDDGKKMVKPAVGPGIGAIVKKKGKEKKVAPEMKMTNTREMAAAVVARAGGPVCGVVKSNKEPIVRRVDENDAKWINLNVGGSVYVNDRLRSFRGGRGQFAILDTVGVQMYGDCSLKLLKNNDNKILPVLRLESGVISLSNLKGTTNTTIDVEIGGAVHEVVLLEKESVISLVQFEPAKNSAWSPVRQFAVEKGQGIIKFSGEVYTLNKNEMLHVDSSGHSEKTFTNRPRVCSEKVGFLSETAKEVFVTIGTENPLTDSALRKLMVDPREYVREYSVEISSSLGMLQSWVEFTQDVKNRNFWKQQVQSMRRKLLHEESFQNGKKDWFEKKFPDSPSLFRMLTLASNKDLIEGGDRLLVDGIQSSELFERTIAIYVLADITGITKLYRPDSSETVRRKWVQAWEKSLTAGEIRFPAIPQLDLFQ